MAKLNSQTKKTMLIPVPKVKDEKLHKYLIEQNDWLKRFVEQLTSEAPYISIQDDGSFSVPIASILQFENTGLVDNGDGTVVIDPTSGPGGDNNKLAVDSLATSGFLGNSSVTGVLRTSAPFVYTDNGDWITLSIVQSGSGTDGYLDGDDWITFNNKAAYSFGANNFSGTGNFTTTGTVQALLGDFTNINGTLNQGSQPNIDHDTLLNWVSDKHIDWTDATDDILITKTGSGARARITLAVDGTTTDQDALITFSDLGEGQHWSIGADDSSNTFKISESNELGTDTRFTIDATGKVGIGTISPVQNLHISSGAGIDGDCILRLESDTDNTQETANPYIEFMQDGGVLTSEIGLKSNYTYIKNYDDGPSGGIRFETDAGTSMVINYLGNVGIADPTPLTTLDLGGRFRANADAAAGTIPSAGKGLEILYDSTADQGNIFAYDRGTTAFKKLLIDGLTLSLNSGSGGNVGIGTATPDSLFHISSGAGANGDCVLTIEADDDNTVDTSNPRIDFLQDGGVRMSSIGNDNNELILSSLVPPGSGGGIKFVTDNGVSEDTRVYIAPSGNVGIGTITPLDLLHISGNASGKIFIEDRGAATDEKIKFIMSDSGILHIGSRDDDGSVKSSDMVIDASGNVGIGTITPSRLLHISSGAGANGDCYLRLEADDDNTIESSTPIIEFVQDGGIITSAIGNADNVLELNNYINTNGGIRLTTLAGTADSSMFIDYIGNIGIRTETPDTTLDLDGRFRLLSHTIDGASSTSTGKGIEMVYSDADDLGTIAAFDRDAVEWKKLEIDGNVLRLNINSAADIILGGTLDMDDNIIVNTGYIDFDTSAANPSHQEGRLFYDNTAKTLSFYNDEADVTLNIGEEQWIRVRNETGSLIPNGSVVRIMGSSTGLPLIELAKADSPATAQSIIGVVTHDIENAGSNGIVTTFGSVHDLDTSACTEGDILYLSGTTDGDWTNVRPTYPNYIIEIGQCVKVDGIIGHIHVNVIGQITDITVNNFNGTILETMDFSVSSNGTTITGSLTSEDEGKLTLLFSDGFTVLDTSPPKTITLTAGTDSNPQTNFVYILESTKVLTVSISDWPVAVEHIKVSTVVLRTASTTEIDGALRNQNWNDHIASTNNQGHLSHISERLRQESAKWDSGVEGSVNSTELTSNNNIYVQTTSGIVYQIHRQLFPLLDMTQYSIDAISTGSKTFTISDDGDLTSTFPDDREIKVNDSTSGLNDGRYTIASTNYSAPNFVITVNETIPSQAVIDGTIGDDIHIVNDFTTPYETVMNLNTVLNDALGNSLNNSSYSIVIWGIQNRSGETSHLMANIPIGSYNKNFPEQSVTDVSNFSVYSIPKQFQGVGFLIARLTFVNTTGTFSLFDTQSLLGLTPDIISGGGATGGGVSTLTGLVDTPNTYASFGLNIVQVNSGETGVEFTDQITGTLITTSQPNIDHTTINNIGTNAHSVIDTHLADATIHFTEGSIDHGSIAGLTDDDHAQYLLLAGRIGQTINDSITITGTVGASNLSGTNTGDQTSIVGITGTKAQFDTAVTDGNFLYDGDIDLSGLVPYTGATTTVNLGSQILTTTGDATLGDTTVNGNLEAGGGVGSINASNNSFAQGSSNTADITASGNGSFSRGYAMFGSIIASGDGSFATGYTNGGAITASGNGSVQIGEGTNSTFNSLQVGSNILLTPAGKITCDDLDVDTLNLNGNVISDSTGTISFDDDNIITDGNINIQGQLSVGSGTDVGFALVRFDEMMTRTTSFGFVLDVDGDPAAVTTLYSSFFRTGVNGTGAITKAVSVSLFSPLITDGTITDLYGLEIQNQTEGTSGNWAIKTGLGLVEFGDDVEVSGNLKTDAILLHESVNDETITIIATENIGNGGSISINTQAQDVSIIFHSGASGTMAFNQSLSSFSSPSFAGLAVTGNTNVSFSGLDLTGSGFQGGDVLSADGGDGSAATGQPAGDGQSIVLSCGDGGDGFSHQSGDGGSIIMTLGIEPGDFGNGAGADGNLIITNLPSSDPGVVGALYHTSGTVKISI